jgi:predicted phosphodiesterase
MKLRVYSDIHLEFAPFSPPAMDADAIVLAGDIGEGLSGLEWARKRFPSSEILYVAGNHEFYGARLPDAINDLAAEAETLGIHFLENRSAVVGGVRFLGATLWTDYALYAKNEEETGRFMFAARRSMNDYRFIRFGPKRRKGRDRVRPDQLLDMHQASSAWLTDRVAEPWQGKTVVVTHHAPHRLSVPPSYAGDAHTPCYASHLPELVRQPVDLWIHGHIHHSMDCPIEGTRVLCNPRGYRPPHDNPAFEPDLLVEI